jgi:UrcA family protein
MHKMFMIALVLAIPGTATAGAPRSKAVTTADLDLSTRDGVARLDRRLAAAARDVCRRPGADLSNRTAEARCQAEALADVAARRGQLIAAAQGNREVLALAH